jgi:hypothetical protein
MTVYPLDVKPPRKVAATPGTYLVLACKPGRAHRHQCTSVQAAAMAANIYRKWGWMVVVLPELPS